MRESASPRPGQGYNHGNPPGWRPPDGAWYHGEENGRAGQPARRRRRRGPPLTRWMWEAFGMVAGWVAVVGVVRLGGLFWREVAAAAVLAAVLAACWAALWRVKHPAALAPAELAAAYGVPGALAAIATRAGTGHVERNLLLWWVGWWLVAWLWVRAVRPPEARAMARAEALSRARAREQARLRQQEARQEPPEPVAAPVAVPVPPAPRWPGDSWASSAPASAPGPYPLGRPVPAGPGLLIDPAWRPALTTTPGIGVTGPPVPRPRQPAAPPPDPAATLAAELGMTPADLKAITALLARPGTVTTGPEAAAAIGKSRPTAARYLKALADAGHAEHVGGSHGGPGAGFRAPRP